MRAFGILLRQFFRVELASKERLIAPLLFAITVLLLFAFAFGKVTADVQLKVYVAQTFLTAFLAMQILFTRIFEADEADHAFDLLKTYPLAAEAWFLSKYIVVVVLACLVLIPTMLVSAFFYQKIGGNLMPLNLYWIALLVVVGLSSVGILTSAMMLKAGGRAFLYPLVYFPLTVPVLIAAIQASLEITEHGRTLADVLPNWLGLLIIFDVIYVTLGILLFGELVKSD
jgi:heme exporter protein B